MRNPSGYLKNAMQREGWVIPTPGQLPCEAVRGPRTTPYVDPFSLFAGHASGGGGGEPSAGHFVVGDRRGRSRSPRGADRRGRSQSPSAPILDVRDLLGKAQGVYATRDIFVIVLLAEIAALRGDLEQGARCRVSHPKNSNFVASMTDMSDFLVRVSSGALKHVALVFPAASRDEAAGNAVWHLCQRRLSSGNCYWLAT